MEAQDVDLTRPVLDTHEDTEVGLANGEEVDIEARKHLIPSAQSSYCLTSERVHLSEEDNGDIHMLERGPPDGMFGPCSASTRKRMTAGRRQSR